MGGGDLKNAREKLKNIPMWMFVQIDYFFYLQWSIILQKKTITEKNFTFLNFVQIFPLSCPFLLGYFRFQLHYLDLI